MRWVLLLFCLSACTQLDDFSTIAGEEIYEGRIIGVDDSRLCVEGEVCDERSFIRSSFPDDALVEMSFDSDRVYDSPGRIRVRSEKCGLTLIDSNLRALPPFAHDELALYDFPGQKRLRNYFFTTLVEEGLLSGETVMVVLSLISGGDIEIRIIGGAFQDSCDTSQCIRIGGQGCGYYGVFYLRKKKGTF